MKKIILLLVSMFVQNVTSQTQKPAPSKPVTDVYHGIEIVDEYRNLENLKDSTIISWMESQTNYSESIIKNISNRDLYLKRSKELYSRSNYFYSSPIITKNNLYFYTKIKSNENYGKLYCRNGFKGAEKLLYDPKNFKPENHKTYLISYYKPSNDGSKVAIALTEGGKEIADIIVFDLESNKILPEVITNTWPSDLGGINWLPNNSGFNYIHIPNINITSDDFIKNTQSVIYKIGDKTNEIKDIFSKSNNPEININKEDFPIVVIPLTFNNYIFGAISGAGTYDDYFYANVNDIYNDTIIWKPFFRKSDKIKNFIINGNDVIYISEKDNKSKICKTSLNSINFADPVVIVEQIKDETIQDIKKVKEGLFFSTIKNGVVANLYFYKKISYKKINLPLKSGSITMQSLGDDLSDFWVYCSGWTQNRARYRYDINTNSFTPENIKEMKEYPEYKDIIYEEIEIKTHDGLDLPLTIIYKKGLKKNGKNRAIMSGYGAYGSINGPFFNPVSLFWILDGGILVYSHERGGGEKGESWHNGGFKKTKPNTWKDFISSAEYLVKKGYTSPKYLGIESASAGGILIGRAITERPDLFKASIINVGVLNTIRFETTPNGPNSVKEFGTVKDKEEFKYLLEMDAFHHIKKGTKYPATLITAGMNDPRVLAWVPCKFAAKLQANNSGENPILLNVDVDNGHGMDNSLDKYDEAQADKYAFFYWQLGDSNYKLERK